MAQINTRDISFSSLYVSCECVYTHMEARRQPQVSSSEDNLKCHPQECCPPLFCYRVFHYPEAHQLGKTGLQVSPRDPLVSTSTGLGLQVHIIRPGIFMCILGIRARSQA